MADLTVRMDVEVTVNADDWLVAYGCRAEPDVVQVVINQLNAWNNRDGARSVPPLHNIQVNLKPVVVPVPKVATIAEVSGL